MALWSFPFFVCLWIRDKHRRLWRPAVASYVCLVCCNSQLNNSKSQAKPRIIPNSKFKIPNSSAVPPKTIFAFPTLNTVS